MTDKILTLLVHLHHQTDTGFNVSMTGETEDAATVPRNQVGMEFMGGRFYELAIPETLAKSSGFV